MIRYAVIVFLLLLSLTGTAQQAVSDLDSLYRIIKKMPSFHEQITGNKAAEYDALYSRLRNELKKPASDFEVFRKLSELILPINDNHIDFNQVPVYTFSKESVTDAQYMARYKASQDFKSYPRVKTDLKKLEQELAAKPLNNIEGIYYNYDKELKIGIYKASGSELTGIVLSSAVPHWAPGDVAFYAQEKGNNYLNLWIGSFPNKAFYLVRTERFENGRLLKTGFAKQPETRIFGNVAMKPAYQLKSLDTNIQYLKLSDFMATDENKAASKAFYNSIKDSLKAPHLIVDLRNNGGGYFSISSQFLNLLRRYANPGKIYAIINFNTVSNAEEFAIKLKGIQPTVFLGQTTMGRIVYGQNYGTNFLLPSGKFNIIPTDLGSDKNAYPYEGKGIAPDVVLSTDRDWIAQVLEYIRR